MASDKPVTPIDLLGKPLWKRITVKDDKGKLLPAIRCENLHPQQVLWLGKAFQQINGVLIDPASGNGIFPVGNPENPTGLIIAGEANLRQLADAGLKFPGSSDFLSPRQNPN